MCDKFILSTTLVTKKYYWPIFITTFELLIFSSNLMGLTVAKLWGCQKIYLKSPFQISYWDYKVCLILLKNLYFSQL